MSAETDHKEMVENNESALDVAYEETDLEEVKPEIDHSKLYVWIADSGNDRIQKFDGNGKFISQFGSSAVRGRHINRESLKHRVELR